jgi:hypothetical protein
MAGHAFVDRVADAGWPNMTAMLDDACAVFCERCGVRGPLAVETLGGGRNSRVERITDARGRQWVLKRYYPQAAGVHDRLGAEYGFLDYLRSRGIGNVARPLGVDRALHAALYTFLPGTRPTGVTDDFVDQAAGFVAAINRGTATPEAHALAQAADACTQWSDHLALARVRIEQLAGAQADSDIERRARDFVVECLAPSWRELEASLAAHPARTWPATRILSPSDFGFHNALADDGKLAFVDFEYAGWDDPAKLACDFICQPDVPVENAQGRRFVDAMARIAAQDDRLSTRVALLLPVHRLKWCCILLNEFRPGLRQRRVHAGIETEGLLASQLDKAQRYFDRHFANFQES